MDAYEPGNFKELAETPTGRALWVFLNEHDNVVRLVNASVLRRPALEALADLLVEKFGNEIRGDRWKQMIGHMTRRVMWGQEYEYDVQRVKMRIGDLFSYGARYRKLSPTYKWANSLENTLAKTKPERDKNQALRAAVERRFGHRTVT